MPQRIVNVTRLLTDQADTFRLKGDYYDVGRAATLVANERTPAGFYETIIDRFMPDGYILGVGCGNAISMVEAFSSTPLGMILVDVDPAVIFIGKMFITCLRRHSEVEGFFEEFLCSGREALERIEAEVLEQDDPFEIKSHMKQHRDRLWNNLSFLTGEFSQQPGDVRPLLDELAGYFPIAGETIPVRAFIARNYAKLHALAVAGNITLVRATIFEPALLTAVSKLPGFDRSCNVIYLSNAVDHLLRRSLCASARSKLLLSTEPLPPEEIINSPADFLEFLSAQTRHLKTVTSAARGSVFVYAHEGNEYLLESGEEFPRYTAGRFFFQFDLGQLGSAVLGGGVKLSEPTAEEIIAVQRHPWMRAPRHRAMARTLHAAAVRGDAELTGTVLERFMEEIGESEPSRLSVDDPRYAAFWIAEVCLAALLVERSEIATPLADALAKLRAEIAKQIRPWTSRQVDFLRSSEGKSSELLLFAQAFGLAGRLLDDEGLGELSAPFLDAALALRTDDGWLPYRGESDLRLHVEALARLVYCSLYYPSRGSAAAIAKGIGVLRRHVDDTGEILLPTPPPEMEAEDGYLSYVTDRAVLCENAQMTFLFYGLARENFRTMRDGVLVYTFSRMGEKARSTPLWELLSKS